jgi:sugar transferase (PEP-CTERM/EpsH1 system associated)
MLASGPLTVAVYRDEVLAGWVRERLARGVIDGALVYSAAMAPYVCGDDARALNRVVDLVDVDSEKWRQYAGRKRWPASWIYSHEADSLGRYECQVARDFDRTLLVSDQEARILRAHCAAAAGRISAVRNGVDTVYFAPDDQVASPFAAAHPTVVFTGAMDYWANVEGVEWFRKAVWPLVRKARPEAKLALVGSNPTPAVQAMAGPDITVTGRVADVRPYLQHAAVVIAPLRIARGIQNKVLEGMAMARPVVVTTDGLTGIDAAHGQQVLVADQAEDFADRVVSVLDGSVPDLGSRARAYVEAHFAWSGACDRVVGLFEGAGDAAQAA